MLEIAYEETAIVKEAKMNILPSDYETFNMEPHEDIKRMLARYNVIMNGLVLHGKIHTNE